MSSRAHSTEYLDPELLTDAGALPEHLPEVVPFTARAVRAAREAGWTITEHRTRGWAYFVVSRRKQLSVYKLVGPHFDHDRHHYCGYRTMIISER